MARWVVLAYLFTTFAAVRADYVLAEKTDGRTLILDEWLLEQVGEQWLLKFTKGGREQRFSVNLFWLADRIDSNSICCGDYRASMNQYLQGLQAKASTSRSRPALVVELAAMQQSGFFVAGLWTFDRQDAWAHGVQYGTHVFGLKAEEVKALGTPAAYELKLRELAEASWALGLQAKGEVVLEPAGPAKPK